PDPTAAATPSPPTTDPHKCPRAPPPRARAHRSDDPETAPPSTPARNRSTCVENTQHHRQNDIDSRHELPTPTTCTAPTFSPSVDKRWFLNAPIQDPEERGARYTIIFHNSLGW